MLKKSMNKNKIIVKKIKNKIKNKIKMVNRDKQIKIRNHKDKDKWLIKINKLNKNRKNNKTLIKIKI